MAATRPRHVLITGGSRGIGLSIAQLFAKKGYRCTLISRSEEHLKAAVKTLQPLPSSSTTTPTPTSPSESSQPPPSSDPESESESQSQPNQSPSSAKPPSPTHTPPLSHAYIPGNISHASHFWSTNTTSPTSFGAYLPRPDAKQQGHASRIDVLVNCAGIPQAKLFKSMQEANLTQIINTNLTSMMAGTRFLMRQGYLRGAEKKKTTNVKNEDVGFSPVVINVSSLLGLQGGYGAVAYAASKAGVLGFTRALATEYASHGVRVNALVPGYVETDMTKDLNASELEQRIPLGRFGKPDEIAHAALFLAENQYAHNCVVNLDGGLSAV